MKCSVAAYFHTLITIDEDRRIRQTEILVFSDAFFYACRFYSLGNQYNINMNSEHMETVYYSGQYSSVCFTGKLSRNTARNAI